MNKTEYAAYEQSVRDFFEREGIQNLSGGFPECPDCKREWTDGGKCPDCGADREMVDEPYFSWRSCDCCGTSLGGHREHATGWNPTTETVQEYEVCEDCIYYAEYGRLDDTTMENIERGDA